MVNWRWSERKWLVGECFGNPSSSFLWLGKWTKLQGFPKGYQRFKTEGRGHLAVNLGGKWSWEAKGPPSQLHPEVPSLLGQPPLAVSLSRADRQGVACWRRGSPGRESVQQRKPWLRTSTWVWKIGFSSQVSIYSSSWCSLNVWLGGGRHPTFMPALPTCDKDFLVLKEVSPASVFFLSLSPLTFSRCPGSTETYFAFILFIYKKTSRRWLTVTWAQKGKGSKWVFLI